MKKLFYLFTTILCLLIAPELCATSDIEDILRNLESPEVDYHVDESVKAKRVGRKKEEELTKKTETANEVTQPRLLDVAKKTIEAFVQKSTQETSRQSPVEPDKRPSEDLRQKTAKDTSRPNPTEPDKKPSENLSQKSTQETYRQSPAEPDKKLSEDLRQKTAKDTSRPNPAEPDKRPSEDLRQKTAKEASEQLILEPTKKTSEVQVKQTSAKPANKPAEELVKSPVKESSEQVLAESAKAPIKKEDPLPLVKTEPIIEKVVKKPSEEQPEETEEEREEDEEGEEDESDYAKYDSIIEKAADLASENKWKEVKVLFDENPEAAEIPAAQRYVLSAELAEPKPNLNSLRLAASGILDEDPNNGEANYAMAYFHFNSKRQNLKKAKEHINKALKSRRPPNGAAELAKAINGGSWLVYTIIILVLIGIIATFIIRKKRRGKSNINILLEPDLQSSLIDKSSEKITETDLFSSDESKSTVNIFEELSKQPIINFGDVAQEEAKQRILNESLTNAVEIEKTSFEKELNTEPENGSATAIKSKESFETNENNEKIEASPFENSSIEEHKTEIVEEKLQKEATGNESSAKFQQREAFEEARKESIQEKIIEEITEKFEKEPEEEIIEEIIEEIEEEPEEEVIEEIIEEIEEEPEEEIIEEIIEEIEEDNLEGISEEDLLKD